MSEAAATLLHERRANRVAPAPGDQCLIIVGAVASGLAALDLAAATSYDGGNRWTAPRR